MKICFIGDIGSTFRTGGGYTFSRIFIHGLITYWPSDEILIVLYQSPVDKGTVASQLPTHLPFNVRVFIFDVPAHGIGKIHVDAVFGFKARGILIKENCDLFIFDQPNAVEAILRPKRSITIFHGGVRSLLSPFHRKRSFKSMVIKDIWALLILRPIVNSYLKCKSGHVALFNSQFSLNGSQLYLEPDNFKALNENIIGLPVDPTRFSSLGIERDKFRKKYSIKGNQIVVMFFSNFAPKKNTHLVPDIIANMKYANSVLFFFVGRGLDGGILDDFCSTQTNCYRVCEINPDDAPKYLNMADILISTSKTETFGYTIAEGMLCEKPTVVFCEGAQIEYVEHERTGLVVRSIHEFSEAIDRLIVDRDLARSLGVAARDSIINKYVGRSYFNKIKNLIERVS